VEGDEATTMATGADGVVQLALVRENELWKLNGFAFTAEIPEGTDVVEVSAIDYGYDWNSDDVGEGDVAFQFTNDGEELHELAVLGTADDFDIEALQVCAEGDQSSDPPGTTGFVAFGLASPGLTSNVTLEEPLAPGGYVFICTVPNAEGTPHVVLNMYSEFTVE
jgi:hypothetical protein